MQNRWNIPCAVCALLSLLLLLIAPFLRIQIPLPLFPGFPLTVWVFANSINGWMGVTLILALLMLAAVLMRNRTIQYVAGAAALVGYLVLGLAANALVAGSNLTQFASLILRQFQLQIDLSQVLNAASTMLLRPDFGFYLNVALALAYLGFVRFGTEATAQASGTYGGGGRHRQQAARDSIERRKNLYL